MTKDLGEDSYDDEEEEFEVLLFLRTELSRAKIKEKSGVAARTIPITELNLNRDNNRRMA